MPIPEFSASNIAAKEAKSQIGLVVEYRKSKWTNKQVEIYLNSNGRVFQSMETLICSSFLKLITSCPSVRENRKKEIKRYDS